jgi:protein arginine N-methyltransferase 1
MYDIVDYGLMIADERRMGAYAEALRRAVKPGAVVIDIGTGTGIFALIACRLGARRVYAIEPDNSIHLAAEVAAANGYADRIEFIQDISTNAVLPETADVIVSDIRGILPLFSQHLPAIIDARRRLLAPEGILIPQCDTLWAAVVETSDLYRDFTRPWEENAYGFDLRPARKAAINSWRKARPGQKMLTEPACWAALDYTRVENPSARGELSSRVSRDGTGHGVSIWFDATPAAGLHFSNSPGEPQLAYGQAFFPWPDAVTLGVADEIKIVIQANLIGDDYVWRWKTRIFDQGNPKQVKADFDQSTFFSMPLRAAGLRKQEAGYLPALNEAGRVRWLILDLMNQHYSLGDIAGRIQNDFPVRFSEWQDALQYVCEISARYSQ